MASRTMTVQTPNREAVQARIDGARFQIKMLEGVLSAGTVSHEQAQSCAGAAIDQLLQAVSAALFGFSSLLPDPLPAQRLNRKNLRDQFFAVEAESAVLHRVDAAAHPGEGWLWSLEVKHDGAAFGKLLVRSGSGDSASIRLVKDPLDPKSGTEEQGPLEYLKGNVEQVLRLVSDIGEKAHEDVLRYREAQRRQARRLI